MRWARVLQVSSVFLLLLVSDMFLVLVHASISTMELSDSVKGKNDSEMVQQKKLKAKINEKNNRDFANVLSRFSQFFSKRATSFSLSHVQPSLLSNRRKRNSDPAGDKKIIMSNATPRYVRSADSSDLTEKRYSQDSFTETSNSPLNYATNDFRTSLKPTTATELNTSRGISLRTSTATSTNYTSTASFTTNTTLHNKQYPKEERENKYTQPTNDLSTISSLAANSKTNEDLMSDDGSATYSSATPVVNADEKNGNFTQHNHPYSSTVDDSNSVNDSNNNTLTSTMNQRPEIWESTTSTLGPENYIPWTTTNNDQVEDVSPPLLSSNSANSIASDPTMESIDGHRQVFDVGAIIGIALGAVILVILIAGICGLLIYNRRGRTLSEVKYPTDNCGYVDDSLRDSSEEMFSLDNDSFLNSLEAMTLQNYWAEDAKNTKV